MKLSQAAQNALSGAIARELTEPIKTICAWCNPGAGDANTSHGICPACADNMKQQITARHAATIAEILEERDPLVVLCGCFGCRTGNMYGCTKQARVNDWQAVRGF